MWFSQGCSIGCSVCNESAPISAHHGGDLCPEYAAGNKTPTIMSPELRTYVLETADVDHYTNHPWRAPGSVPGYDPCGVAGGDRSNRSFDAGGFGYTTGYPQGFPGTRLPKVPGGQEVWTAGGLAEVAWVPTSNHGGGYQYSLCPAWKELTEACFEEFPLQFLDNTQKLRYMYLNQTDNTTEVEIPATRVSEGVLPAGSTWTKNPIPAGSRNASDTTTLSYGGGQGNLAPPQFTPPEGCDEHCWGYLPCNIDFVHPAQEGWADHGHPPHEALPECAAKNGEGCCHTLAYMAIVDQVKVPEVPVGDYVLRWRWDAEQSPQIWSGCADVSIVDKHVIV